MLRTNRSDRRVSTRLRQVFTKFSEFFICCQFSIRNFASGSPRNDDRPLDGNEGGAEWHADRSDKPGGHCGSDGCDSHQSGWTKWKPTQRIHTAGATVTFGESVATHLSW